MCKSLFTCLIAAILFSQIPEFCFSQSHSNPLFGVGVVQHGLWSVVNNPAGLSQETSITAGTFYQSPLLLKQLASSGIAFAVPLGNFSILGVSYQRFGYSLYQEQKARMTLSKQLGKIVSAGIRFDYLNTAIGEGYGNASSITGTAGLIIQVTDELRIGVSLFNPQRTKFKKKNNSRYPVIMEGGAAWQFGKHAEIAFGVNKSGIEKSIMTASLDYRFSEKFNLNAGFTNGLYPVYFGYEISLGNMNIGMCSGYHQRLGFSPQVKLSYKKS